MNSLWFEPDLKKSTDTARIHHQLAPNELVYETWMDQVWFYKTIKHKITDLYPVQVESLAIVINLSCILYRPILLFVQEYKICYIKV